MSACKLLICTMAFQLAKGNNSSLNNTKKNINLIKGIMKKLENRTDARVQLFVICTAVGIQQKNDNFFSCCSFLSVASKKEQANGIPAKNENCVFCSSFLANLLFGQSHRQSTHECKRNLHFSCEME